MNHEPMLLRDMTVDRARLWGAEVWRLTNADADREVVVHVLTGMLAVIASHNGWRQEWRGLGERSDVFSAPPTVLYLGTSTSIEIYAESRTADCIISTARINDSRMTYPALIRPQDVMIHEIGEGYYRRIVRECIGGNGPALRLRVGETLNPPGGWSSWPHHEFDANPELAPKFEEVFYTFTKPIIPGTPNCEAYLRRRGLFANGDSVDDIVIMSGGDSAVVPLGYHPIAAGVDSSLLYCWHYISPISKRYGRWAEDGGYYA